MKFTKELFLGFASYGKAIKLISKNGLGIYFLFPLLMLILFVIANSFITSGISESIKSYILDVSGLQDADFLGSSIISFITAGFVSIVSSILVFSLLSFVGGYAIIILMSPILSILSEKVDKILTGNNYPFSAEQTMRDIVRGILLALRNGLYSAGISILIFIAMLIPVIGMFVVIISPFLFFIVSSYFYGFSFMDYSNERYKRNIKESVRFIRQHKGVAIGNGIVFNLFLMVPWIGGYLAAFVSVLSVVAATISVYEISEKSNINKQISESINNVGNNNI